MTFDRRALLALAAAGTLWGSTVPATKLALQWLPPGWLTVARFGLAAAILLIACRSRLRAACSPAVLAWGAVGYGGTIFVQNAGVMRTSVTHAALLVGATPVLVAVIAALRFRSVARPAAWAGYAVSLAGVGLVAGAGAGGSATLAGDGLVLVSLVLSAWFTVAQTRLLPGRDPVAVTALQFLAATVAAAPVAAVTEGMPHLAGAGAGLPVTIALALGGTLAPFTLFAYGQARVSAAAAATFLNLEPLIGAAAGVVMFGDPFGLPQLAGAAAILAGIAVSSRALAERRAAPDRPALLRSGPVGGDELVHDRVDAPVDLLPGRVLVVPGDDLPRALLERDGGQVVRHDAAQLGVVEHHRVRLVAEQAGPPARIGRRDRVRRHVHDVGAHPGRRRQGSRDLVPGQHVVGGDVERLADRPGMAEQRHEAPREVRVVCQCPQ
jgi:drug/metabolite transporter (DMT)-like permease